MATVFGHGQLRLYLLWLLESGPRHGYELIVALSDRFAGTYRPSAGTVYPRLSRLEEEGLVVRVDDGRKATYELTEQGRAELAAHKADLAALEDDIARMVRERADQVRHDVREAMAGLRIELAGAAERAREAAAAAGVTDDDPDAAERRAASHARRVSADATIRRFADDLRADLRRADADGEVGQLTVDTLVAVLDSARAAVRGTLRR
jgi:DNA-binding PadR family transcriptional regulator